ncbi:haloacid dehalogenase type II [Anabaena azotica]|uniref:Haloacid dehalogenase type II n=1 Tax=Anabaena azotica FACHB-119 TaxID=947527 RepID=A0ABR8D0M0_9NOST|nr:haloacid dehalogenase type II [Anabaena azotica]MBD2499313.1 haloacid dehalogenase type II [Anabaena azotica FACHB-119]
MLELNKYKAVTFDCYGTLINWEEGIITSIKPILQAHNVNLAEEQILENFAEFESELEQGEYITYREVLRGVVQKFGDRFKFHPTNDELNSLANSLQYWQPFPDTVAALKLLKQRYKLVIISNVDNDLFAFSAKHLQVEFDEIITAEQVKSYKPSLNNFRQAIERIGLPQEQILHIAASIYHDIVPAKSLGISTVWVNRRTGQQGSGASLPATAQADLEVPDLQTLLGTGYVS